MGAIIEIHLDAVIRVMAVNPKQVEVKDSGFCHCDVRDLGFPFEVRVVSSAVLVPFDGGDPRLALGDVRDLAPVWAKSLILTSTWAMSGTTCGFLFVLLWALFIFWVWRGCFVRVFCGYLLPCELVVE